MIEWEKEIRALLRLQKKEILTPAAMCLYLYFRTDGLEKHTLPEIQKSTGICMRTIRNNMPVLALSHLAEIVERDANRWGGAIQVKTYAPDSKEVKKAVSSKGNLPAIRKYRRWEHHEQNIVYSKTVEKASKE